MKLENPVVRQILEVYDSLTAVEKSIADFRKIHFIEKVILPAFNLSESDTGRSSGSTMFGENSAVFPAPSNRLLIRL